MNLEIRKMWSISSWLYWRYKFEILSPLSTSKVIVSIPDRMTFPFRSSFLGWVGVWMWGWGGGVGDGVGEEVDGSLVRSPPWLYHLFVHPICSFVTSQLKEARKHTSQPDYLRIFSQLVHELAGRLTVYHLNQLAVTYYFNNPQYPNIYILIFSSLFLLHITFKMTCYMLEAHH